MSDDWLASLSADPENRIDWLVRNYWKWICSEAYRLTGNWHDAEDIAQDAYVRVAKFLEDKPDYEVKAPRPWLSKFLHYAFLDFLRKMGKSAKYGVIEVSLEQLETISPSEWQKLLEELVDDVSESTASNERMAEIKREIVKLRKVRMRTALYLNLIQELTYPYVTTEPNHPLVT